MDSYITAWVAYTSKTAGRDKIFRLIQYTSKMIGGVGRLKLSEDTLKRLKSMEGVLSTARKTFRLGKAVDSLQSAAKSWDKKDPVLRFLLTSSNLCSAAFLYYDMLGWAAKADVLRGDTAKWSHRSSMLWMVTTIFKLLRDLYELQQILESKQGSLTFERDVYISLVHYHKALCLDFLKNLMDLVCSMQSAGHLDVSMATVGGCGVVASLLGIIEMVYPTFKL